MKQNDRKYDSNSETETASPPGTPLKPSFQPTSIFKVGGEGGATLHPAEVHGHGSLRSRALKRVEDNPTGDRFEINDNRLHTLLDFTEVFSQDMRPGPLMEQFHKTIGKDLRIDRILFFFQHKGEWRQMLNVSCDPRKVALLDVEAHLSGYRRTMMVSSTTDSLLNALELDVVIPLPQNSEPQAYVLLGSTEGKERGISPIVRNLAFAQSLATVSFIALQNFYFFSERLHQEEVLQQLKVAGQLQLQLIPRREALPEIPGIEVAWLYRPFYDIGGDYFDIVLLDSSTLAFCIADVSGKGIPASLQMTNFRAYFRAMMNTTVPLTELANHLNSVVYEGKFDDSFITFFTGRYHLQERRLEYLNAGHNAPLLWDREKEEYRELHSNTLALGMLPTLSVVKQEAVTLTPNTLIMAYTDGLVEYRSHGKDHCDIGILLRAIQHRANPSALVGNISDELEADRHNSEREVFDDISLLAIMHKG